MSNHNNNKKDVNIRFGSVNCRHLLKQSRPQQSDRLIRYLRLQSFDILACQETNFNQTTLEEQQVNIKYKLNNPHQSFWTTKCGIINNNQNINMELQHISEDQRVIFVKLTILGNHDIAPLYVLNLYAPASDEQSRRKLFYCQVLEYLNSLEDLDTILGRMLIMGDFNFSFANHLPVNRSARPRAFMVFMRTHFHDCINVLEDDEFIPTFKRNDTRSCIDYIFAGTDLRDKYFDSLVDPLPQEWTDHALLSIKLQLGCINMGKGIWRANPHLTKQPQYVQKINNGISIFVTDVLNKSLDSPQVKWDRLKGYIRKLTQSYCRNRSSWRQRRLKYLYSRRNGIIRQYKYQPDILNHLLLDVEAELASIQREITETAILRAGKKWIENNERDVGYLKRTIERRVNKQQFVNIVHPTTGVSCLSTTDKVEAVHHFYQHLYANEPIQHTSLERLLANISKSITTSHAAQLMSVIDLDTILTGVKRCPKVSSPGRDGLPYPILRLILEHPLCSELVYSVYNDALTKAVFPKSWQETCIVLLPKKGNLADLANWRPISLINTDCKVFTRIMNSRVIEASKKIINQFQAGFMPNRFIGDHGMALNVLIEDATKCKHEGVGIAIDSAKAYDYVNEEYICSVLDRYGFPAAFITCIRRLFFNTRIVVNMNGFLTPDVQQQRGLRQGDAISPILFNFALEPLLLSILNDTSITGYAVKTRAPRSTLSHTSHKPLKLFAYADDLLVLINSTQELERLKDHLYCYSAASNSRVNFHKSVAFPLGGKSALIPPGFRQSLQTMRFQWFDSDCNYFLRYLGYPIFFTNAQRDIFCNETVLKLKRSVDLHQRRAISVYGRAHMVNSLFLSRFWHVLRVVPLPNYFLQKISSIAYQFITHKIFPPLKKSVIYHPKSVGGLSVIDPHAQQKVLQQRYAKALISNNSHCSPIPDYLLELLTSYIQLSYGTNHHQVPLLFRQARQTSRMRRLHALSPIFKAIDSMPFAEIGPHLGSLSLPTILELPFLAICISRESSNSIFANATIKSAKVFDFLQLGPTGTTLIFKYHKDCRHPTLCFRIKQSLINGSLCFYDNVSFSLLPTCGPSLLHLPVVSFAPCLDLLQFEEMPIFDLPNSILRQMYMRFNPLITNTSSLLNESYIKRFLAIEMKSTSRNLWFRLLHNKIPSRSSLRPILQLPDDLCLSCGSIETACHLLFTCPAQFEIWRNFLVLYFAICPPLDMQQIYHYTTALQVAPNLQLLDNYLKVSPLEVITCILSAIWSAHWRHHFDHIPIVDQSVLDSATKQVRYISALNHLR